MQRPVKQLVIGILSSEASTPRADQCRKTWVSELASRPDVEVVFIVGNPSASASSRSGDVLTVPCPDGYEALPQKVRHFIAWALTQYDFEYLFKCDDDTYVCVPRLIRLLQREMFGRAYVGCRWGRYAQGGAGYLLSRGASDIVFEGLKATPTGPEDLYVGRSLRDAGIELSDDWRFRADCRPVNVPRPGNMIITCHRCRAREMERIHPLFAGVLVEPDVGSSLITVHAWAADYGMLGVGGNLGFSMDGRSKVITSLFAEDANSAERQFFSAHATSRLIIDVHRPAAVVGFLDDAATDRSNAPVEFAVDDRQLGTLCGPGVRTTEALLSPGRYTLKADCTNKRDNSRRYSVWAACPTR